MTETAGTFRQRLGLRPVINCSGTMTSLGASIAVPGVAAAMAEVLPEFVEIGELQKRAGEAIAAATGAELGFMTASCSAGVSLAVAGAMTGIDPAAMERLPDTAGLRNEVVVQAGHLVHYGAPVDQAIRLTGAAVVSVGQATSCNDWHLSGALGERTAAIVHVVSHHCVEYGLLPLETVVEIAHAAGVPVIVDAASEYDLSGFLEKGADIVLYSAHKFLGGPTAGIVAGHRDLVRAAYLHTHGIGRGMKIGKESIVGAMAALAAWRTRDHAAMRARERAALRLWQAALDGAAGMLTRIAPDPTGNPLDRLRVDVDAAVAGGAAWDIVDLFAESDPPVVVRAHEVENGYFFLDPCNLHDGEAEQVAGAIRAVLARLAAGDGRRRTFAAWKRAADSQISVWPD